MLRENADAFHGLRTLFHNAGALAGSGDSDELTTLGSLYQLTPKIQMQTNRA